MLLMQNGFTKQNNYSDLWIQNIALPLNNQQSLKKINSLGFMITCSSGATIIRN